MNQPADNYVVPAETSIGHVHLKVADLDRAIAFYRDVLGFQVTTRFGQQVAFLSAGGYHHHIALNTWHSRGAAPAPSHNAGLYHFAIRYATRAALTAAVKRVLESGVPLEGASDHGVSLAIYFSDPDGNGVELTWDRPVAEWPRDRQGNLDMLRAQPLDLDQLLAETEPAAHAA